MTAREVLEEVDRAMRKMEYELIPDLFPFKGEPVEPYRDRSYTAYFASFQGTTMSHCLSTVEMLVVETCLVATDRLTQDAYRNLILAERDAVLDALLALAASGSRMNGRFEPATDGLSMRTVFEIPCNIERTVS